MDDKGGRKQKGKKTKVSNAKHADKHPYELRTVMDSLNAKRRLVVSQLRQCWEKYGPHMPPEYVMARLVETGEMLLGIEGFHDVAESLCFSMYLEKAETFHETSGESHADLSRFSQTNQADLAEDVLLQRQSAISKQTVEDAEKPTIATAPLPPPDSASSIRASRVDHADALAFPGQLQPPDSAPSIRASRVSISDRRESSTSAAVKTSQPSTPADQNQAVAQNVEPLTPGRKSIHVDLETRHVDAPLNEQASKSVAELEATVAPDQPDFPLPIPPRVSQENGAADSPLALQMRCEYGKALCHFLHLVEVDPTLKSDTIRKGILDVMKEIKGIMDRCAVGVSEKNSRIEWLVLNGSFHLRVITGRLEQCQSFWPEAIEYLKVCASHITSIPTLRSISCIPWLVDIYMATYKFYSLQADVEVTKKFVAESIQTVDQLLEDCRKHSSTLSNPAAESEERTGMAKKGLHGKVDFIDNLSWIQQNSHQNMIRHAIHQLNLALLACLMKELSASKKLLVSHPTVHGHEKGKTAGGTKLRAAVHVANSSHESHATESVAAHDAEVEAQNSVSIGNVKAPVHLRRTTSTLPKSVTMVALMEMALGYDGVKKGQRMSDPKVNQHNMSFTN
ncbi:hypothetical protein HDV05_007610 [Chytridiales sp. JEL 0842]|nr:hypothetical protein HDV05_007610 [Chytridiales sp. JEL 0842]